MIGLGMLGRAELFFVVLNICYIDNSIISAEMFFALTIAAMLLNITVPVSISLFKPYYISMSSGKSVHVPPALFKASNSSSVQMFDWLQKKVSKDDVKKARNVYHPPSQIDVMIAHHAEEFHLPPPTAGAKRAAMMAHSVDAAHNCDGWDRQISALSHYSATMQRVTSKEEEKVIDELATTLEEMKGEFASPITSPPVSPRVRGPKKSEPPLEINVSPRAPAKQDSNANGETQSLKPSFEPSSKVGTDLVSPRQQSPKVEGSCSAEKSAQSSSNISMSDFIASSLHCGKVVEVENSFDVAENEGEDVTKDGRDNGKNACLSL
jgi:hypothetical protein